MTTLNETMNQIRHRLPMGWTLTLARVVRHTPIWAAAAVVDGTPIYLETRDGELLVRMAAAAGVAIARAG
jgi:hypothetical protein